MVHETFTLPSKRTQRTHVPLSRISCPNCGCACAFIPLSRLRIQKEEGKSVGCEKTEKKGGGGVGERQLVSVCAAGRINGRYAPRNTTHKYRWKENPFLGGLGGEGLSRVPTRHLSDQGTFNLLLPAIVHHGIPRRGRGAVHHLGLHFLPPRLHPRNLHSAGIAFQPSFPLPHSTGLLLRADALQVPLVNAPEAVGVVLLVHWLWGAPRGGDEEFWSRRTAPWNWGGLRDREGPVRS